MLTNLKKTKNQTKSTKPNNLVLRFRQICACKLETTFQSWRGDLGRPLRVNVCNSPAE